MKSLKLSKKKLAGEINAEIRRRTPEIHQEHLEDTILHAKALYERRGKRERIGFWGLLLRQVRFIGWKVWFIQFVILIILIRMIGFIFLASGPARHIPYVLCASGILMVWTAVPMIERSIRYRMFEIENTTLFSAGRLMTARLIIISGGIFVMAAAVMCLMTIKFLYSFSEVVFSFILPLMAASALFLYLFRRLKIQSLMKGCNLAGGTSITIVLLLDRVSGYNPMDLPKTAGWILCILCLMLSIVQVIKMWEKECYEEIPEFG